MAERGSGHLIHLAHRGLRYLQELLGPPARLAAAFFAAWASIAARARSGFRNAASAALLERLGMRREGHLREST
jgi:RimJ/RimL family protein N-acetyltransferase